MTNEIKSEADYDSPWKEALEVYFPQFMQLLFTEAFEEIDWSRDYEFLNTELQKVVRDADSGRGHVDKLVKVYTLEGIETWVLIHIEIQAKADKAFNQRMYRYNYRLVDCYPEHNIVSFAVLTNQRNCAHLGCYSVQKWGMKLRFDFPVLNLQDWRDKFSELEASDNLFSVIILAQLTAHNVRDHQQRFNLKLRITRLLYQRGYNKQQVLELFRFIDWMLRLPKELELKLDDEIEIIEEANKVAYVTSIERFAMERGEAIGEIKGEAKTLLKLFKLKFGLVSDSAEEKILSADKSQLDIWVERILTAETVEDLFKEE